MTLTGGCPVRRSAASATANFSEHQTRGSVSAATISGRQVRNLCKEKTIPTFPRGGHGSSWRIPTARFFEQLGLPYEVI